MAIRPTPGRSLVLARVLVDLARTDGPGSYVAVPPVQRATAAAVGPRDPADAEADVA